MARLNFRTGVSSDRKRWYIDDIPDDQWLAFQEAAKKKFPEKGNQAWAVYLSEAIASLIDPNTDGILSEAIGALSTKNDDNHIFLMSEIPTEAIEAMRGSLKEAKLGDEHTMLASMLDAAQRGTFHVVRFDVGDKEERSKTHEVLLSGVPLQAIENIRSTIARMPESQKEYVPNDEASFFGFLIEGMYHNDINFGIENKS